MSIPNPKTYYWVGGSTGSTSASRFDWNVASNWRVLRTPTSPVNDYNLLYTDMYPIGGDNVYIGYGSAAFSIRKNTITSPLLFGGFSGPVAGNTGCWICDGSTGNTLSGASGTTFNSALSFVSIGGDYANFIDNCILGGGLTGSIGVSDVLDVLKSTNVIGMNSSYWDALSGAATTRQSSLNIKSAQFVVSQDYGSSNSNGYFHFAPQIVDFYRIVVTGTTGSVDSKLSIYSGNKKILAYIKDAKINTINVTSPGDYYLINSVVLNYMDYGVSQTINTDQNCYFGSFKSQIRNMAYSTVPVYYNLNGTFNMKTATAILGWNLATSGSTIPTDEFEVDITMWDDSKTNGVHLGGSTFSVGISGGSFVANAVRVNNSYNSGEGVSFENYLIQPVTFTRRATVDRMSIHNCKLDTILIDNAEPLTIREVNLRDKSSISFRSLDGVFDNWRIGLAQGAAAGITLSGGIIFHSSDAQILGDPGVRFINYGVYKNIGVDIRNSKLLPTDTEASVIAL